MSVLAQLSQKTAAFIVMFSISTCGLQVKLALVNLFEVNIKIFVFMVDLVEYLLKPHHKMFNYCIFKSKKFFLIYSYVRFTSDGTGPFFTNNSFGVIVPPLVLYFGPRFFSLFYSASLCAYPIFCATNFCSLAFSSSNSFTF